ncbi:MAG: SurA N-terminal domain-containing protein [Nevskiales bacterium]|nr:SurA N-terminal domain-containing protein [Nevskiales bacterium]
MLQNIRDRLSGPLVWIVVGIILVPFAFFGIETFRGGSSDPTVARVGKQKITQSQFRQASEQRARQLQQWMGENFRPELVNTPRFREVVLNDLVLEQALIQHARQTGYRAYDAAIFEIVSTNPEFQEQGKFSPVAYRNRLARESYTPALYESQARNIFMIDQMREGILSSAWAAESEAAQAYRLEQQQRWLAYAVFEVSRYLPTIRIQPEQVQARYDEQQSRFQSPERIRLAYVELALEDLPPAEKPDAEVLRVIYESDKATRFSTPEERRARHILIGSAADADRAAARKRLDVLAKALEEGADFAALAAAHSEDPGSKNKGGDLGWIRRGQMLEPFEQALFALDRNGVSKPVETEFGWHLIRLEGVHPAVTKPFEDAGVQAELLSLYRQRDAERRFQERSEKLEQLAFESPGSLEPVAQALGLTVKGTDWITRAGGTDIAAQPAVVEMAFSENVLNNNENSPPLTIGDNRVAVIRKQDHEASQQQPLEKVMDALRDELKTEAARQQAASEAAAALDSLGDGRSLEQAVRGRGVGFKVVGRVPRAAPGVDPKILEALFRLPRPEPGKASRTQVTLDNGDVAVLATTGVEDADWASVPTDVQQQTRVRLREAIAGAEFSAYVTDLQNHIGVETISPPEAEN